MHMYVYVYVYVITHTHTSWQLKKEKKKKNVSERMRTCSRAIGGNSSLAEDGLCNCEGFKEEEEVGIHFTTFYLL